MVAVATLRPGSCGRRAASRHTLLKEGIRAQDSPGVMLPFDQRVVSALVGGNRDSAVNANLQIADALGVGLVVLGVLDV